MHPREQVVDWHPLADRAARQCGGDRLAAGLGRGQRVGGALALDVLDATQLVDDRLTDPGAPQRTDRLGWRLTQRGAPLRGQLQPAAGQLGQPTGLYQQRPRERGDRLRSVEVPTGQHLRHRRNSRGGRPLGLLAAPQLARPAQVQHGQHAGQRLRLRGANCLVIFPGVEPPCVGFRVHSRPL